MSEVEQKNVESDLDLSTGGSLSPLKALVIQALHITLHSSPKVFEHGRASGQHNVAVQRTPEHSPSMLVLMVIDCVSHLQSMGHACTVWSTTVGKDVVNSELKISGEKKICHQY